MPFAQATSKCAQSSAINSQFSRKTLPEGCDTRDGSAFTLVHEVCCFPVFHFVAPSGHYDGVLQLEQIHLIANSY